jgi:hypothetical protein
LAHRELHDAMNDLRKVQGELPLPYVPPGLESCSFCGKGESEVRQLVAGPGVHICNECVVAAQKLLGKE